MYCIRCGTKNPDDARFCKQCGRQMEPAEEPAQAHQPEAAATTPVAEHVPDPEARFAELMAQARRAYERDDFEAAREACRDALDLKPDSAEAHALLSTVYEHLGDIDRAIAERERVVELNPNSLADKEKLDALRVGIAQVGARRRIVSPRIPPPTFWDTSWGAAIAAAAAGLAVLLVGYGVLAYREAHTKQAPPTQTAQNPVSGTIPSTAPPNPAFTGAPPAASNQPAVQPQAPPSQPNTTSRPPAMSEQPPLSPLPIRPEAPPLESRPRDSGQNRDGGFFDPSQSGTSPANPPANPSGASGSSAGTQGPGRIEIVVAPRGDGSSLPSPNTPSKPGDAALESRNNAEIARNLQLAGKYREAASAWERALAGAGGEAARYHQNAALCYQRIGDKANARRHYQEAIRLYQEKLGVAEESEAAKQGIQACQAGLRLTQ